MLEVMVKSVVIMVMGTVVLIIVGPFVAIVLKIFYHLWCGAMILLLGGDLF